MFPGPYYFPILPSAATASVTNNAAGPQMRVVRLLASVKK
jgi:hypothetical protein